MINKKIDKIKEFSPEQLSEFVPNNLVETIEYLKVAFPPKLPTLKMSDREIWIEVGKQQIIEYLESKEKNNNVFP
tara:strand:+ start:2002 stop:2226 length:225 start_codon:yes stop_codon:yes gene_type:complete